MINWRDDGNRYLNICLNNNAHYYCTHLEILKLKQRIEDIEAGLYC